MGGAVVASLALERAIVVMSSPWEETLTLYQS